MSCKGYNKRCWLKRNDIFCCSCRLSKDKDALQNAIFSKDTYDTFAFTHTSSHTDLIKLGDNFDVFTNKLLKINKAFLSSYLARFHEHFMYRIYTHSDTALCPVIGWALHTKRMDLPIPGACLTCLAHNLRYSPDKYIQNHILRSVIIRYEDSFNLSSIVKRTTNERAFYEFGCAILEEQGLNGVFGTYMELIKDKTGILYLLQKHPFLHKMILDDTFTILKKGIYSFFKKRKDVFNEELFAKAYHPSRFMNWCFDHENKEGMDIPPYVFKKGCADWNIEWS